MTVSDQALVQTAGALSLGLRAQDLVARWGGGELLFLLPDSGLAAALVVAEGVRERVAARSIRIGSTVLNLTLSVGVASYVSGQSVRQCIEAADTALYQAKREGRDRVVAARTPPADAVPGAE